MKVKQVVVAGAETDVCVLQSVMGLLEMGFQVFVLEDCLFSDEKNITPALDRMYKAGAIPCTFKTFYYEMMRTVEIADLPKEIESRFQRLRKVAKSPYKLPAWDR